MASRREHKQDARAQRIARAAQSERRRRLKTLGAISAVTLIALGGVIALTTMGNGAGSTGAPQSSFARTAAGRVQALLAGLPQSRGNVLGKQSAPVTVTEFSDLECSACDAFHLGSGVSSPAGISGTGILDAVIRDEVATGRAKLVYRSLETATAGGATPEMWALQQAAVNAAGLQGKAWHYIELFYSEQGAEGSGYVTMRFLQDIARQIPGLDYEAWLRSLRSDSSLRAQTVADNALGTELDQGRASTPTIWIKGPKNSAAFQGITMAPASETAAIEAAIAAAA